MRSARNSLRCRPGPRLLHLPRRYQCRLRRRRCLFRPHHHHPRPPLPMHSFRPRRHRRLPQDPLRRFRRCHFRPLRLHPQRHHHRRSHLRCRHQPRLHLRCRQHHRHPLLRRPLHCPPRRQRRRFRWHPPCRLRRLCPRSRPCRRCHCCRPNPQVRRLRRDRYFQRRRSGRPRLHLSRRPLLLRRISHLARHRRMIRFRRTQRAPRRTQRRASAEAEVEPTRSRPPRYHVRHAPTVTRQVGGTSDSTFVGGTRDLV